MAVKIHGKDYTEVAERITSFIDKYGDEFSLQTEIKNDTETHIDVICSIQVGDAVRTGMAREYYELKNSKAVNFAHALENAETSAVGRALTWWGFGGDHVASAEDMGNIAAKTNARQSQLKGDDKPVGNPSTEASSNGNGEIDAESMEERRQVWSKLVDEARATFSSGNYKAEIHDKLVELYGDEGKIERLKGTYKLSEYPTSGEQAKEVLNALDVPNLNQVYQEVFPNLVETG